MNQVKSHYDNLLAVHYSWMSGMAFADKVAEQRALLESFGFPTESKKLALDLGCGPGYQSVALCDLGYEAVMALDTSQAFLDELATISHDLPIKTQLQDIRDFSAFVDDTSADAIVCMGDTITHLVSMSDVSQLLSAAYKVLCHGGRLALTFRDFSKELTGTDRFIPVRSDDQHIMMCALLYSENYVEVNDLIYQRCNEGWRLHKSSYRKLRLDPALVAEELRQLGFVIEVETAVQRMQAIVAHKM
ncbi:MAG: class I SAM-dependent methyltransferase [Geminicoccaceae bacterium]